MYNEARLISGLDTIHLKLRMLFIFFNWSQESFLDPFIARMKHKIYLADSRWKSLGMVCLLNDMHHSTATQVYLCDNVNRIAELTWCWLFYLDESQLCRRVSANFHLFWKTGMERQM